MRRILAGVLMMTLLLAGCAGGSQTATPEDRALALRQEWQGLTACSGTADLTADYGDRVFDCRLSFTYDTVTGLVLTVETPQLLSGLTARMSPEGAALTYDGVSLETGPLTDRGISPLEGLPTLYTQLVSGYLAAAEENEGELLLTLRSGDTEPGTGLETELTFDAERRLPLWGALSWDGARVLTATFENVQMMTGQTPEE